MACRPGLLQASNKATRHIAAGRRYRRRDRTAEFGPSTPPRANRARGEPPLGAVLWSSYRPARPRLAAKSTATPVCASGTCRSPSCRGRGRRCHKLATRSWRDPVRLRWCSYRWPVLVIDCSAPSLGRFDAMGRKGRPRHYANLLTSPHVGFSFWSQVSGSTLSLYCSWVSPLSAIGPEDFGSASTAASYWVW